MKKQFALILLLTIVPPAIAFGTNVWIVGRMADGIASGLPEGRLEPCPPGVDCVSSVDPTAPVEPFAFEGDPDLAYAAMLELLREVSGAEFVIARGDALVATFARPYVKTVEDVELVLDREASAFQVRAIARTRAPTSSVRARIDELRGWWRSRAAELASEPQRSDGR